MSANVIIRKHSRSSVNNHWSQTCIKTVDGIEWQHILIHTVFVQIVDCPEIVIAVVLEQNCMYDWVKVWNMFKSWSRPWSWLEMGLTLKIFCEECTMHLSKPLLMQCWCVHDVTTVNVCELTPFVIWHEVEVLCISRTEHKKWVDWSTCWMSWVCEDCWLSW